MLYIMCYLMWQRMDYLSKAKYSASLACTPTTSPTSSTSSASTRGMKAPAVKHEYLKELQRKYETARTYSMVYYLWCPLSMHLNYHHRKWHNLNYHSQNFSSSFFFFSAIFYYRGTLCRDTCHDRFYHEGTLLCPIHYNNVIFIYCQLAYLFAWLLIFLRKFLYLVCLFVY